VPRRRHGASKRPDILGSASLLSASPAKRIHVIFLHQEYTALMRPFRRAGAAFGAALVLGLSAAALFVVPVAATDVGNDAQLRTAWANATETLITLTGDITLACTDQPERDSDTDIVVDGNGFQLSQPCENDDALHATGGGNLTLQDITVVGNALSDDGIDTEATIHIVSSTITGFAEHGVESEAPITVTDSAITSNGDFGIESGAQVTVTRSVVADNGNIGVWSGDEDDAIIADSTISGNGGNGVDSGETAVASGSTIVGNGFGPVVLEIQGLSRPAGEGVVQGINGGGLDGSSVIMINSTVVDNNAFGASASTDISAAYATVSGNDINLLNPESQKTIHLFASVVIDPGVLNCVGAVADEGNNFVDDDSCVGIAPNAADPLLGALANNGGPTFTRLPVGTSPLVNGVPLEECGKVSADQRGVSRPQQAGCDIGAVEVLAAVAPTPTQTGAASPTPVASQLPNTSAGITAGAVTVTAALAVVVLLAGMGGLLAARLRRPR
jgi:Right handed beta helix region